MNKKIAVYHDYLNQYGGAERVLEALRELFPGATVFTLYYDREAVPRFHDWKIKVSPAQHLPFIRKKYQAYFWLFPFFVKLFDFGGYDVVISSTHAWGNGLRKKNAKFICYCHTPIRYFWDLYEDYRSRKYVPLFVRLMMPFFKPFIRSFDRAGARQVDTFLANSAEVKGRIQRSYGREAAVVHPPVDTDFFGALPLKEAADYYLVVTRLRPYKGVGIIVEAFNQMQKKLIIVGTGSEEENLKKIAGESIQFHKNLPDEALRDIYRGAIAYVYMAHEDFGMSLVEAQAAGIPVIAFGRGGAREIVIHEKTGLLFGEQSAASLIEAVHASEKRRWNREVIRENAQRFSKQQFIDNLRRVIAAE